jgi:transposase
LQPLYALAIRVVLASHVIHTDDTSVKVRDAWRKLKHKGYFWPYVGDALHPLTVFDYTATHQRDGPAAFLKDYRGYLQADAFNGYDGIYLQSQGRIIEVACWAHARRKFHESRRLDAIRMETALAWIGKLYAVEKELRERCMGEWQPLSLEERAARIAVERQERSRPLLDAFHLWLETEAAKVLPKSAIRGAMDYTLNNWTALSVYVQDGWLDIDNNEGENSLRGLCLGRKNWLFLGSDRGGDPLQPAGLLQASRSRSVGLLPRRARPSAGDAPRRQRRRPSRPAPPPLAYRLTVSPRSSTSGVRHFLPTCSAGRLRYSAVGEWP